MILNILDASPRIDINGIVDSTLATARALVKELDLDPVVLPGDKGDFIVTVEFYNKLFKFCTIFTIN